MSDPPSEVIYLRDDETGELWSATPAPIAPGRRPTPSATAPGFSTFEHEHGGIATQLTLGMAEGDAGRSSRSCA